MNFRRFVIRWGMEKPFDPEIEDELDDILDFLEEIVITPAYTRWPSVEAYLSAKGFPPYAPISR